MTAYRDTCSRCVDLEGQVVANAKNYSDSLKELSEKLKAAKKERSRFLREWFGAILLVCTAALLVTFLIYRSITSAREPIPDEQCRESAEIISSSDTARYCPVGAEAIITMLEHNKVLVRCACKAQRNE